MIIHSEVIYTDEIDGVTKGSIRIEDSETEKVLFVGVSAEEATSPDGESGTAVGIIGAGFVTPKESYKELEDFTNKSGVLISSLFAIEKKLAEKTALLNALTVETDELEILRDSLAELAFESFDDNRNVIGIVDLCLGK